MNQKSLVIALAMLALVATVALAKQIIKRGGVDQKRKRQIN
jgi:hypothetical protein